MAITMKQNIRFWATSEEGPPPIRINQMTATQGILIPNSPLEMGSTGLMEASDTDDTVLYGLLCGVVNRATTWPLTAALAVNDEVRVAIVRRGDLWAVYCDNGGDDAAVAQANVGQAYAVTVDGSTAGQIGYTTMDLGDTSGTLFTVVDIASNVEPALYATTDSPGLAIVRVSGTLQG